MLSWRKTSPVCMGAIAGLLAAQSPPGTLDYDRQVDPILAARCLACHSQEKRSGGLSLGTYADALEGGRSGAAIKPGNRAGSLLLKRVTGETEPQMPLGGDPLSAAEISLIRD